MFFGPVFQLIQRIGNIELREFEADCPVTFEKAIMQCFEADPADRPDALDLLEVIEKVRFEIQRKSNDKRFVESFLRTRDFKFQVNYEKR